MNPCRQTTRPKKGPAGIRFPAWKRVLDIFCILVLFPILAPLMLCISVGIKLVSPGPVFFRQTRVGASGKLFTCLKFRSMKVRADSNPHQAYLNQLIDSNIPMTKMDSKGDPRLIPLGKLLRASGLDELAQLINVVRGEMSIVGPRPCTPYEFERYHDWHKLRLNALPGLTGLWQVSNKNRVTFDQMVLLDLQYIENLSFWKDIKDYASDFPYSLRPVQRGMDRKCRAKADSS